MLLQDLQYCLLMNCHRPSAFHFLVGHDSPIEFCAWPVRVAVAGKPGGGLVVVVVATFAEANAVTNCLLVAVRSAIVLVRDAMVAA